jgi:hypothetical protein
LAVTAATMLAWELGRFCMRALRSKAAMAIVRAVWKLC